MNQTDIDLSRYGIYTKISEELKEPCLLRAFRSANILTDVEFDVLKSFVKTRTIPQTVLKEISELFNIYINCKILYTDTQKTSHVDFGLEFKENRSIKLIIINSHYILNERTNITQLYIKKYVEINNDDRFKNHPRKTMLSRFDTKRYSFAKQGMKISKLIQLMIDEKLLVAFSEQDLRNILEVQSERCLNNFCEGFSRPIVVASKKPKSSKKYLQTKHFFGYEPDPKEVSYRISEIQTIVDSLPLR